MKEKMTITLELSKNDIAGLFFMLGEELTDEQWEMLSERPVLADLGGFDKSERQQIKLALAAVAIASMKE